MFIARKVSHHINFSSSDTFLRDFFIQHHENNWTNKTKNLYGKKNINLYHKSSLFQWHFRSAKKHVKCIVNFISKQI